MDITQLVDEFPENGSGVERSGGLHVSRIVGDIAEEMGFVPKRDPQPSILKMKFEFGFAWEDLLSKAFADRNIGERPGEVSLDGIIGSPDSLGCDEDGLFLEEYKSTWYSMNKGFENIWMWHTQAKSYCKLCRTSRVFFRVLWINGDYRPPSPQYHSYLVKYTDREIDENWEMLVNHAKFRGWL